MEHLLHVLVVFVLLLGGANLIYLLAFYWVEVRFRELEEWVRQLAQKIDHPS